MKPKAHRLVILLFLGLFIGCEPDIKPFPVTPETRPWTRWWWMGSAVNREGITQHLEAFGRKGFGGVEIVPIYGEKGDEKKFIPYLTDEWIQMLIHTLEEAERLNMKVDLALGTGWPMGGPWITESYAARKASFRSDSTHGSELDPEGDLTGQQVKRAAPGGEGYVVDHFSSKAIDFFLQRFDSLIHNIRQSGLPLRAVFNDSYEVYGADWTPGLTNEFISRRGYDLLQVFPDLLTDPDTMTHTDARGWSDYHQTVNDLLTDATGYTVRNWCDSLGVLYRYQAHGSPANLLDLYATAHIPETESFGPGKFTIPGLRIDPDFDDERFGRPNPLVMKFASSPANLLQKRLVSAETATWLGNHFKVSLAQVKPQIDQLFLAGINHIFYHGITYSDFEDPFPGKLFYASTNFGPSSSFWPYIGELNEYVTNCQKILQNTEHGNDLLVYFPVFDLWQEKGKTGNVLMQDVHNPDHWLFQTPFGRTVRFLREEGYSFDYISDRLLDLIVHGKPGSARYKVLLIPPARVMPAATFRNILALVEKNIKVVFLDQFPVEVPGYYKHEERLDTLRLLMQKAEKETEIISGNFRLMEKLDSYGIHTLNLRQSGVHYIRKFHGNGVVYFFANLGNEIFDQQIRIPGTWTSVELYDPSKDKKGSIPLNRMANGTEISFRLQPGESLFVLSHDHPVKTTEWLPAVPSGLATSLDTGWEISFSDTLTVKSETLSGWTTLDYPWAAWYCGEATYRCTFSCKDPGKRYVLDLGDVREMATVEINGREIGKAWHLPYQLEVPAGLLEKENLLSITVRNLDANRIIRMDLEEIPWKNFYDINFVDITYEPFDASTWEPLPSGLKGPVRLIPAGVSAF